MKDSIFVVIHFFLTKTYKILNVLKFDTNTENVLCIYNCISMDIIDNEIANAYLLLNFLPKIDLDNVLIQKKLFIKVY